MKTTEAIEAVIKEDGIDSAVEWIAGVVDEKHNRIEQLEAALKKIAAIEDEHINVPKTEEGAHLWTTLAMCVELAETALGEKKDD